MASKGQNYKKYDSNIQDEIMNKVNAGHSLRMLAKKYNIPFGTIATWTHKKNHPELVTGNKRGKQKEKDLTIEDYKERYEILKKYQAFIKAQRERK